MISITDIEKVIKDLKARIIEEKDESVIRELREELDFYESYYIYKEVCNG